MNPKPLTWEFLHFELCQTIGISQSHTWHLGVRAWQETERERRRATGRIFWNIIKWLVRQMDNPLWNVDIFSVYSKLRDRDAPYKPNTQTLRQIVKSIHKLKNIRSYTHTIIHAWLSKNTLLSMGNFFTKVSKSICSNILTKSCCESSELRRSAYIYEGRDLEWISSNIS